MEIHLTKGRTAIIDDGDSDLIGHKKWYFDGSYACTNGTTSDIRSGVCKRKIYMHRLIAGASEGEEVDHLNGNGLDNRRCNLRVGSHANNMRNTRIRKGTQGTERLPNSYRRNWRANIYLNGRKIPLGYFDTQQEAHEAYLKAKAEMHGTVRYNIY